ncbi:hypothetical protein VYU27_006890 [Nannochloropsis oceanica]
MAYPNSYVPTTTSKIPNDYYTGTGLASSSYGRPDRLASYGTPPSSSNSVPHQYPPQELYVNDSTLSQVASAKNGITLWLSKTEFHPGEIIGGKMRATFAKRTTAKSVCARLSCGAGVEWSTGSGERSVVHKAYTALAPPITVILQENQGQSFFLEPHRPYEWAFQITLPPDLPSCFSYKHGTHISYGITLFVDIPNWPDYKLAFPLKVHSSPMLITPEMQKAVDRRDVHAVTTKCCFSAGQATLSLSVPNTVFPFVDGTSIDPSSFPISLGVDNQSSRTIECVSLSLMGEIFMTTVNDPAKTARQCRIPFLVAGIPIVQNLLPGACLPVQPVVNFPPLFLRWNPKINVAEHDSTPSSFSTIQMPTTTAGHILKVSYKLVLTAQIGCIYALELAVPITFAASLPLPLAPPIPKSAPDDYEGMPPSAPPMQDGAGIVAPAYDLVSHTSSAYLTPYVNTGQK